MFSVTIRDQGVSRKFDTLADSAADLEVPFRKFGAYLKGRAIARFEAQDFAPLAESTVKNRISKGLHSLERKLAKELRRAHRRAGTGLAGTFGAPSRGVQNRLAILAEFQKRHARDWIGRRAGIGLVDASGAKPLSIKQLASLGAREDRALAKAVGKKILEGLNKSFTIEVGAGSVTVTWATRQRWSEAHNEGGTTGHGAKLPARPLLVLESQDLDVFAEILKEHNLLAFEGASNA